MKEFAISRRLMKLVPTKADNDPLKNFLVKHLWAYPLFAIVIYSISSFFINAHTPRIITSLILGFFPWKESMKKIFSSNYKHMRTQLLILLQVLTTSVSSGYSIEKSLTLIRPVIEHSFGSKSVLINPLITLENNIKVHMNLDKALDSIRKDYSHLIAWYDPSMERSARECRLIREVESGLREREFTFYLQPKCNMLNGKVVGAEALVRWFRKDGTVVRPDHFVPLLEEHEGVIHVNPGSTTIPKSLSTCRTR